MVKRFIGSLAAIAGIAAMSAMFASPAFAADFLQVNSAALVARGAGVTVTITVTCDPYTDFTGQPSTAVDVNLGFRQAVRHGNLTTGSVDTGYLNICDSTPHQLSELVMPSPYAAIKGSSIVTTTLTFNTFGGAPFPVTFNDVTKVK
jgi:hypothetical protein